MFFSHSASLSSFAGKRSAFAALSLCRGPHGGPRGMGVSSERGIPVRTPAEAVSEKDLQDSRVSCCMYRRVTFAGSPHSPLETASEDQMIKRDIKTAAMHAPAPRLCPSRARPSRVLAAARTMTPSHRSDGLELPCRIPVTQVWPKTPHP